MYSFLEAISIRVIWLNIRIVTGRIGQVTQAAVKKKFYLVC